MNTVEDKVMFVWWNTSLSAGGKSPLNNEEKTVVWETINYFTSTLNIDFLAFSEVSGESIKDIKKYCDLSNYVVIPVLDKFGKAQYDLCLIYKKNTFSGHNIEYIVKYLDKNHYKAGVLLDLVYKDNESVFHIIASHWSSRLHTEGEEARYYSSQRVRAKIDDITANYIDNQIKKPPYIILMGDYNDEPFDKNISLSLMGSRDKNLVKKKPSLLYNPFWKELGTNSDSPHIGSYYDKRGNQHTNWNTFDQMLYSHAFIGISEWTIIEHLCRITVPPTGLLPFIISGKSKLDHLPIIGAIQRNK